MLRQRCLMLRRCLESPTPRFGMVLPSRAPGPLGGLCEYGTMLEIRSVQMLLDGRSLVETVGSWRFKILEKDMRDGYNVGRIECIDDISDEDEAELERLALDRNAARSAEASSFARSETPAPTPTPALSAHAVAPSIGVPTSTVSVPAAPSRGPSPAPAPPQPPQRELSTAELMANCMHFVDKVRSGSAPWLQQRLNSTLGPMPANPREFSYWMALVMPIDEHEKAKLLPIRSPRLRLRLLVHWIEQLNGSWWFNQGCVVH